MCYYSLLHEPAMYPSLRNTGTHRGNLSIQTASSVSSLPSLLKQTLITKRFQKKAA